MKRLILGNFLVLTFICLMTSCSSDSTLSSGTTTDDDGAITTTSTTGDSSFPVGFAVSSPTASGSGTDSSISALGVQFSVAVAAEADYLEKVAAYTEVLLAEDTTACEVILPALTVATEPDCYGPALDFINHPDAGEEEEDSGQLPTGDLGIWTDTESGEACTSAKINQLIESTSKNTDYTMLLSASMLCLMEIDETDLPSEDDESIDLTEELNEVIQVNNSDTTITSATITNLADVEDTDEETRDVYLFTITSEVDDDGDTQYVTSNMKHMPTATDNSTYKGRIWTLLSEAEDNTGDLDAFSVSYELASSTSMIYQMVGANYQLATESTSVFTSNGEIDVAGDWSGNIMNGIINMDPDTGLGDFSFSWQAGSGDDKARIFNGYTDSEGGCGFFGYGEEFDNDEGTLSDNVIDGFICNWAGPGNDHSMSTTEDLAQKQCMIRDEVTGVFAVDEDFNNISYAPTVDCDSEGVLEIKLTDEDEYDDTAVTNDLVDLTDDEEFDAYTAPSAPDLPSSF